MNQTRLESLLERLINTVTGFVVSYFVYKFYIMDNYYSAFYVTSVFTVVSFIRGYLWRRFFNAGMHKAINEFASSFIKIKFRKTKNGTI